MAPVSEPELTPEQGPDLGDGLEPGLCRVPVGPVLGLHLGPRLQETIPGTLDVNRTPLEPSCQQRRCSRVSRFPGTER